MYNVLVVDDDDSIILYMSRLLKQKFSCQVFRAENGLEALSIVENNDIAVIFLDITMPVMDGVETLRKLRNTPRYKNLPVVMMTAVSDKSIVSEILSLGIFSYMLKPLMYDSSYKAIKTVIDSIEDTENLEIEEEDNREKILIIDEDNKFRNNFVTKLSKQYIIFDSDSSSKGLNIFIKEKPTRVFLSENLPLLSEYVLAEKIVTISKTFNKASSNSKNNEKTCIYLMKQVKSINESILDKEKSDDKIKKLFTDVFVKSSETGILLRGSKNIIRY